MSRRARVVVVTYEQLDMLRLALRGYLRQTVTDFTLCVSDDGSGPATGDHVRAFAREAGRRGIAVEHVWQEDRGYRRAAALNAGVRARGAEPLLVFSDGDCIPPAHFVERHLAAHRPRSFHVGGVIWLRPEDAAALDGAAVDAGRHEALVQPADRRDLSKRARKSRWGMWLRRRNRPKVLGANVAFDRTLFEELNGYDENYEGWGWEDSDIRTRAMRLRPRPDVRILYGRNDVFHLPPPERRARVRERNRAYYYDPSRPARCEVGLRRG